MSIASEITRLQNAKSALATSIGNKGVTVPASTKLDGYSALVDQIQTGGGGGEGWQRPSDWPDYSKIPLANVGANEVYLTYDCRLAIAGNEPKVVSFRATANGGYTVEVGVINNNGFTATSTVSKSSNSDYQELLPTNLGDYVVYRITSSSDITSFYLSSFNNYIGNRAISPNYQSCVEMYGKLENITNGNFRYNYLVSFNVVLKSITTMRDMFNSCYMLENVGSSEWDTSHVTDMQTAFNNCYNLRYIDTSGWDLSNATTIGSMFSNCHSLLALDVSDWNVSSVIVMAGLFGNCNYLEELDVSNWNVGSVTTMQNAFSGCRKLKNLDVSNWNTSSCTNLSGTFSGCNSIAELDVSSWDVSSVTSMNYLFDTMTYLNTIDVSSWDFGSVTAINNLFSGDCFIKTLRFNNTLTILSSAALYNTPFITSYIFESTTPPTMASTNVFFNINSIAKIYVPDASVNAYKTATNWSTYASYIYPLSDLT